MSDIPEINKRIKILRAAKGLSQRAFADEIGYTHGTIASVELGKTPVEKRLAVVICAVFGVNPMWLQDGEGEMYAQKGESPKAAREIAEQYILEKFRALSPELQDDVIRFCSVIIDENTKNLKKRLDAVTDVCRESGDEGTGTPIP